MRDIYDQQSLEDMNIDICIYVLVLEILFSSNLISVVCHSW